MGIRSFIAASLTILALRLSSASAETYHVRTDGGDDKNNGTSHETAFKTIQKGADVAQPGDTVLVCAGTYRERVKPPRGGTGEDARITYMANPGDRVVITGLDVWSPAWTRDGNLHCATPADTMFADKNYVDGGNPFKIEYWCSPDLSLGQVVVDGEEYPEQASRANADNRPKSWWADKKAGAIHINFGGSPDGKTVEIVTRRGVFRPYLKGLGYITVQGFDMAYCGNNGCWPGVTGQMHILYQSGMVGTRQGHHWKIVGNRIRNAKGVGLTFSIGTDLDDALCWDPHGMLNRKPQIEVDYPGFNAGDNETDATNSQLPSRPYKEVGFNIIACNLIEGCGMNAIAGLGSLGNTIYGNQFTNNCRFISGSSVEDATIKMHLQYGTLIERNLFETDNDHRTVWLDNNVVGTVLSRNVFVGHAGGTPTIFFEIASSLDQYLSVVDNNLFINCTHGVVSAAADGVAFYNNLFYKGGDGFAMGVNRDQSGSDYGNMRIHSWNNLFVDQVRAFGFGYNQAVNHHTSDYNLMYRPASVPYCKYLLTDGGTGRGPGGRPNVTSFSQAQIAAAKAGDGNYWQQGVNWGANNGPNGCEADLANWRGTMGQTIDRHSEERPFTGASHTKRTITLELGSDPGIGGPARKAAALDFFGKPLPEIVKAGPFQDLGPASKTYTFWDDRNLPTLPALPAAPADAVATVESPKMMKLAWTNKSLDAKFMHVERRVNGGPWTFWGFITTTQDSMQDYDLNTAANNYEYRVAARNAAGISPLVEAVAGAAKAAKP